MERINFSCIVCGKRLDTTKADLPWCSGNCEWIDIMFAEEGIEVIPPAIESEVE